MEEIRRAAKAVDVNLSVEERNRLKREFTKLDRDGDGKISLQEFMTLSFPDVDAKTSMSRFFRLADENRDDTLQLDEFVTLIYMYESCRPRCDGCGDFIGGLFFTCKDCCFGRDGDGSKTYDLCIPCYHRRLFVHDHSHFIDNYTLLATFRKFILDSTLAPQENPPLPHLEGSHYSTIPSAPPYMPQEENPPLPHLAGSHYSTIPSAPPSVPQTANPHSPLRSRSFNNVGHVAHGNGLAQYHHNNYPPYGYGRVDQRRGGTAVLATAGNFLRGLFFGQSLWDLISQIPM